MKNIYLHDSSLSLYQSLNDTEGINIKYATAFNSMLEEETKIRTKYPKFNETTFINRDTIRVDTPITIDYDIIETFRSTQLKVEHYLSRFNEMQYVIEYTYFDALNYLYNIFSKGEIDCVLTFSLEHGRPFETIAIDLAKHFNIPAYTIDICVGSGNYIGFVIYDHINSKHINLSDLPYTKPDIASYFFYETLREKSDEAAPVPISSKFNSKKGLSKKVKEAIFYKSDFLYYLLMLYNRDRRHKIRVQKQTRNYYASIAINKLPETKFIYYSLHVDPEATTMVRETLANQIMVIRMISESLPKGWVLCVKEHPAQFNVVNRVKVRLFQVLLHSQHKFRGKRFYDEIKQLNNVQLLSLKIPSKEILAKASAVGTINGTVSLESLHNRVPVLHFGKMNPYLNLDGIFKITSPKECKNVLRSINNNEISEFSNINSVQDFVFEAYLDYRNESDFYNPVSKVNKILHNIFQEKFNF